jgi:hypothetical protein
VNPLTLMACVVFAVAVIPTVAVLCWWEYDVMLDRRHTVLVTSPAPIFAGKGDGQLMCEGMRILIAQPGESFRVQRIRYLEGLRYRGCEVTGWTNRPYRGLWGNLNHTLIGYALIRMLTRLIEFSISEMALVTTVRQASAA